MIIEELCVFARLSYCGVPFSVSFFGCFLDFPWQFLPRIVLATCAGPLESCARAIRRRESSRGAGQRLLLVP